MQRHFRGRTAAILPLFLYAGASVLFWRNILPRALGNMLGNRFDNPTDLLSHIPLRESQHRYPELFEFALPFSIALERILVIVAGAVDLDGQLQFVTVEIDDIVANRDLTVNLAIELCKLKQTQTGKE